MINASECIRICKNRWAKKMGCNGCNIKKNCDAFASKTQFPNIYQGFTFPRRIDDEFMEKYNFDVLEKICNGVEIEDAKTRLKQLGYIERKTVLLDSKNLFRKQPYDTENIEFWQKYIERDGTAEEYNIYLGKYDLSIKMEHLYNGIEFPIVWDFETFCIVFQRIFELKEESGIKKNGVKGVSR